MLLCLFVFLWKIIRNMSTISATIQHERQLELLIKQQLMEHQHRNLRQLQKAQSVKTTQTHYQKLRKSGRDKVATKENYLLHRFLFGTDAIPEHSAVVMSDGSGQQEEPPGYLVRNGDEMGLYGEKGI